VISADEKSQLQALRRFHRGHPPGPGRVAQVEFEYKRGGTFADMGAYDVHQARLIGSVAEKTGNVPFTELVERVMTQQPYANARTVCWVVDNGSSHHGQRSIDRIAQKVQSLWISGDKPAAVAAVADEFVLAAMFIGQKRWSRKGSAKPRRSA
jgi:hypothetical protein